MHTIQRFVCCASPRALSGDEARAMVGLLAEAERAVGSGIALFAPVVIESGSYAKAGHGSASDWLGALSGTSSAAAKGRLAAAERAASDPMLTQALHEGELSAAQLKLVSEVAAVAPGAADTLLDLAGPGASHQELNAAALALRTAARSKEDERARRLRVHRVRHLRAHQCAEGGIRGEFFCDEVAWAKVAPWLEAGARERHKAAGYQESLDAHRLDTFLSLLGASDAGGSKRGLGAHTLVIVDAAALRRGSAVGEELCEIEGIGPVSVEAVTELVGEGGMQFLVRDGADITTVTSTRRALPQRVEAALLARDRTCVVPGCGKRHGLEADHCYIDYGDDGPTCLENLSGIGRPGRLRGS